MRTAIHTISSDEESNDSLPDIGVSRKPVTTQEEPETFTLSSDGEEDRNCHETINSVVRQNEIEDLQDVCEPATLSYHSEDSSHLLEKDHNGPHTKKRKSEEVRNEKEARKRKREEERKEKEAKRKQREEERQRRAAEKAEAKAAKEAERTSKRALKPGECMKYIVVEVDRRLVETVVGSQVVGQLGQDGGGVRYRVVDASVPAAVTFIRVNPLTLQESWAEEAVVVMGAEEFVELVEDQIYGRALMDGRGLCHLCRTWQTKLHAPRLTLVVVGIDEYIKGLKSKKQHQVQSAVLGDTNTVRRRNRNHTNSSSVVTRIDIETALVMAQLECDVNHRLLSSPEKIATFILQVTKAVAEAPFKRERNEALFSWYAEGSSSGGVRVDKGGVGLLKLWHQQLCQFSLVGVEVAQAVAREYPAPRTLMKAYERCATSQEAALLLADVPIRRGTGVLASTRRIGPELSKKIHILFTATDPDQSISQKT